MRGNQRVLRGNERDFEGVKGSERELEGVRGSARE